MTNDTSPRLIGRKEVAAYLGIGESTFSLWVQMHKMPQTVPGTRKWDRKAIDARLDELSGLTSFAEPQETPLQKWRRERDARRGQGDEK